MRWREFISLLGGAATWPLAARAAAVAVTLPVLAALSSAASAQQARQAGPPPPSWRGTFEWTHICVGGGNTDETRGVGELELNYREGGSVDARRRIVLPDRTLNGRLTGTIPERVQTIPPCSFTYIAPGTFSAMLVGSYTPEQDKFSAQAVEVRTTPGRASWTCPAGTTVTDQPFFTVYEGPMFEDAFRELRRAPDGSMKSSGERAVSVGQSTCTTTYVLTLRGGDCFSPDKGFVFYVGTNAFGGLHPEPTFDSAVLGRPPVGGRYVFDEKRTTGGQTWFHVRVPSAGSGWLPASALSCVRPTVPPPRPPRWPSRQPPPWDAELNPGPPTSSSAQTTSSRG